MTENNNIDDKNNILDDMQEEDQGYNLEDQQEKAILVAVDTNEYSIDVSFDELEELARSANVEVLARVSQKRDKPDKSTFIGKGRLEEVKEFAESNNADLLIFDQELSATQIRNIEDITKVRTIDRTMLILDIFSQRANSSEGRLQVELARQKYYLPRLSGMGISLSRLGGGGGGGVGARRGSGETKLETDRRHIRRRITALESQFKDMERQRDDLRRRRKKNAVQSIAIVGYTNVGKSTLLNKLTGSDVLAENMLFATLDPTVRRLELPDGRNVVAIDTVGLVRRLPHHLVEAFKSTLEEAKQADLILNVCDASNQEYIEQIQVAEELLDSLGASDIPVVVVMNKCDQIDEKPVLSKDTVYISAKTGMGLDDLLNKLVEKLPPTSFRYNMLVPYSEAGFINKIREDGKIFSEEFKEDGILVDALVDIRMSKKATEFKI